MTPFWNILHSWDQSLTLFINSFHSAATDQVMMFLSDRAVWFPLYAIIAFFLVKRLGWKKGCAAILCVALCLLACDQTSNLLKYSVARLRPCYSEPMMRGGLHVLENRGSFYGFFSAHAANAFGFAMCTSVFLKSDKAHDYRWYVIFAFIWAALISISRMFVGKHYFGDITAGAFVGCAWGALMAAATLWIFVRFSPKAS